MGVQKEERKVLKFEQMFSIVQISFEWSARRGEVCQATTPLAFAVVLEEELVEIYFIPIPFLLGVSHGNDLWLRSRLDSGAKP